MLSVIFGLLSALSWGAGDFTGGLASRKASPYRVVMYGEAFGLLLLFGAALVFRETAPAWKHLFWSAAAGAIGSFGLMLLYRAMASGQMSIATPISALLAAILPVIASAVVEGLPPFIKIIGFGCALLAVWLISQDDSEKTQLMRLSDLRFPLIAGLCFGIYFILIHQATTDTIIFPMIASRSGGMLALLVFVAARREGWGINRAIWPLIALNATLDVGGNAFYILAGQAGRLDVAAILSSLYPGATVILAWLVLKEKINLLQKLGIVAALAAIVLMTV